LAHPVYLPTFGGYIRINRSQLHAVYSMYVCIWILWLWWRTNTNYF